ncbi:MAG: protein kinase domain-containing protein, partial [Gammaproteobacteria bacterium]
MVQDVPTGLLIDGSWRNPGDRMEVLDPAHETVIAAVADAGVDEGLDAVAAAHAAGVIHRDLKPANLIACRREPAVRVLDFGLSKAREP